MVGEAALDDCEVARHEVAIQVRHERADLDVRRRAKRRGVDARPGDRNHPQSRDARRGHRVGSDHPAQQRLADPGAADGHDEDPLGMGP